MNIPQISSIESALRIYYSHSEIGNSEITMLFGKLAPATIARLKKIVKNEMTSRDMNSYGMNKINTTVAYETWGIDVPDLERRKKKLVELNLL